MNDHPQPGFQRAWRQRRRRFRIASVSLLVIWSGCSIEKNYKTLSFFFDGVPSPTSDEPSANTLTRTGRRAAPGTARSWHAAYVERRCVECHGEKARFGFQTSGFSELDSSTCRRCHEGTNDAIFVHGPVGIGDCLACHQPHTSPHPLLLNDASPALCLGCHDPLTVGPLSMPTHSDLTRDCTNCHFGHGGGDRYFLKPAIATGEGGSVP